MTEFGDSLIRGAKEALAIAKGELEPAAMFELAEETEFQRDAENAVKPPNHHVRSVRDCPKE